MRNLKRTLSLALAGVMLMGMMVIGAGAASKDFTDAGDIKNVEAVDVMVALGVLEGGDKGDFQPNSILTREQAAKIICYLLLGEEAAEKLATSGAVFSDVAADRWSAPYIGYCVNLGILAGDGSGHFFPEGKLTGAAFAKMLLVALGYDPKIENYTGSAWTINVAADAIEAGISPKGLVLTNELSRQDAAQMAYQTLTATMVKYDNKGIDIDFGTGSGSVSVGASTAEPVKATKAGGYLTVEKDNDEYVQFCEKYFSDLTLNAKGEDAFGRPANVWTYEKDEVGTYAKAADASYTDAVKSGTLYTDLGLSKTTPATVVADGGSDTTTFSIEKSNSTKTGGKGVLTEAYVDADKNVTLVQINTYVGQVSKVATADDVKKDEKPYIEIDGLSNVVYGGKFETAVEYAEDDIVLYTYDKSEKKVMSVALAEKVEDLELTSTTGSTKFVAGGTTYEYNATAAVYGGRLKDSINVYLDTNGYVVYVEKYEAGSTNYAFVLDTKQNNDGWNGSKNTYEAKLLLTDGSVVVVDTDKKKATENTFVSYTVDDNDVYTLTAKDKTSTAGSKIEVSKGTSKFTADAAYYANSSTIFLVHDNVNDEYVVYTGIANMPTMNGAATVYVNTKNGAPNSVASIVYISAADTVVSDANKGLVYIIAGSESDLINDADKGEYYTYNAVVDGETTTINVAKDAKLSADVLASKLTYNSKDLVTNITAYSTEGDDKAISGTGTLKTTDGTVGLQGAYYTYAENVVVYKIEDNEFNKVSVTSIREDADDTFNAVIKDGEVVAIFITVVEA
ncbi:MAG: S-layer homology domain-containing protein [Clostridiales bacterium]|uniref:S-layer homology domain-containing protein n=1 Tax=Flavonifractor porci TaxID=3133422 RepID=UPI0030B05A99|nr:S-layer homology domain-containing protein [Clostridiales bacterium]